jgi:hypothetical protein
VAKSIKLATLKPHQSKGKIKFNPSTHFFLSHRAPTPSPNTPLPCICLYNHMQGQGKSETSSFNSLIHVLRQQLKHSKHSLLPREHPSNNNNKLINSQITIHHPSCMQESQTCHYSFLYPSCLHKPTTITIPFHVSSKPHPNYVACNQGSKGPFSVVK